MTYREFLILLTIKGTDTITFYDDVHKVDNNMQFSNDDVWLPKGIYTVEKTEYSLKLWSGSCPFTGMISLDMLECIWDKLPMDI